MSGRVVVVTGAFGVLGGAVADAFAAQGDKVARVDYAPSPGIAIDGGIDIGGIDLTNADAALKAVSDVVAALGSIDILVNVAGGFTWETLADGDATSWNRMFAMNAVTCINMTRAALPELEKAAGARIINIGAGSAVVAAAGMGSYAASKMAVHKLTESLAAELMGKDITVNAILPSIIDTPTNRADMPDADFGQWVQPAAVADVILFLASPGARAISGALIPVSRGG
ncbi:SDR family NAD(P)-dependent oxidoreductase [Sphingobium sp. HBC34]|uniref:SDR family NAD(P)-dependent oxidoreductase n=1 Tax=Sphingobium cyanobacteriorum TaxID=3063954 RepID=A0ABT8ZPM8_9SPHN|nr:SDR family NAD(P)-dependent oxidoreductase [Sphingobium sp. HBC34]MDO7836489.1 SDR family NAD(P)-dependent oxidoreductase [Sphingobium sp. HBC34]